MEIHFKCRRCRCVQSADVRRAGSPFLCPTCGGEMLVPSASEPLAPREAVTRVPASPAPVPERAPVMSPFATTDERPPERPVPHRLIGPRWAVAAAVVAVLLLGGGYVASWAWVRSGDGRPVPSSDDVVADATPRAALPAGVEGSSIPPPENPPAGASRVAALRGQLLPLKPARPRPEIEERPEEPAAEPPPRPAAAPAEKPAVKRRQDLSEEDLRKQLARVPEVGLGPVHAPALLQAYQNDFQARARVTGGISLEPTVLLQIRPDLKGLPVRQGRACQLDQPAAVTLQTLSQKLRIYLQAAVPPDREGKRPAPVLLREALRLEMRGQRPEWLRAEAIPTLLQLLTHEDAPIRMMLVDLLAEIPGPRSTAALAQRAVFDLAPEVRSAAIEVLRERSRDDARAALLYGLRYPWGPAADHAAEALMALTDRDAVSHLVSMLNEPDPACVTTAGGTPFVREVVRANHLTNCLMCHPPGLTGNEPVLGLDPVVRVPALATQRSAVQRIQATPGSHGYGLGGASSTNTTTVVPVPLLIRGDVTYLRQDFSIQLLQRQPTVPPNQGLRFDYLVRTRPATTDEAKTLRATRERDGGYPQREAILFALRELTGQDGGTSTDAWLKLFPAAPTDAQAARLTAELVQAPPGRKEYWLNHLRDGKGAVYTQALGGAIPRLVGTDRDRARTALHQRLTRMTVSTLRDKLGDESAEVRRAAALACAAKEDLAVVPDLAVLLEDPEPSVVQAARTTLQRLTGEDFGPATSAGQQERGRAAAGWQAWWQKRPIE